MRASHPLSLAPLLLASAAAAEAPRPPAAAQRPVTDSYHGVAVVDDYRWLEDAADPEVRRWVEAQAANARAVLDGLPRVAALRARLEQVLRAPDAFYTAIEQRGGRVFALRNQPPKERPVLVWMPSVVYDLRSEKPRPVAVKLPPIATVGLATPLEGDDMLVSIATYLAPTANLVYDAATGETRPTALARVSPVDTSGFEVIRESAIARDGTRVPMNIIRKKGARKDRRTPTLLYGYGGYGISEKPTFKPAWMVLVEQGWIVASANLRGGGEFGEAWHLAGNLTRKQNVFDDFHACATRLVKLGLTNPKKLAIQGGSNGGLLMGAAMTQHPEAYAAVVANVGIFDMLRVENDPNGAFNVTEFGSVEDRAQFEALRGYSPLHRVRDGVRYPPVLLTTGLNDPRVKSYHSFKMAARLQAAHPGNVALLRVNRNAGHGAGKLSDAIELAVDAYAFLFHHLGVK